MTKNGVGGCGQLPPLPNNLRKEAFVEDKEFGNLDLPDIIGYNKITLSSI